jgi:hypothetical protein
MAPGKMIMLEIGGQPVTVMVEREQLEDLAAYGYPAERAVYVTTWNDHQIDDSPTGRTAAARRRRWPPQLGSWATNGSR